MDDVREGVIASVGSLDAQVRSSRRDGRRAVRADSRAAGWQRGISEARPARSADAAYRGGTPEHYDRYLVSLLFEEFASELAALVPFPGAARILEVACGTGAMTRAMLARAANDARLIATDLSEEMIAIASGQVEDERLSLRQADATGLPFESSTFDTVVSAFGAMFYPDRPRAYLEAARVLRRGGTLALSVWDALSHNPFAATVHESLARFFPDDAPDFLAKPYGYSDLDVIETELQQAGFSDIAIHVRRKLAQAPSAEHVARGLILGTPVAEQVAGRTDDPEPVIEAVTASVAAIHGERDCVAPIQAILIIATNATPVPSGSALEYARIT